MKHLRAIFWLALFTGISNVAAAESAGEASAKVVFDQLKTLVGSWKSINGNTVATYSTIANGTTLIETWTMSPTRQSMTVYTMDGDRLLATHYCPQGNAPRMRFVRTDQTGAHHFTFQDGSNLQDANGSHEHAFWVRLAPSGTLIRNETYIKNSAVYNPNTDVGEEETFSRVATHPAK